MTEDFNLDKLKSSLKEDGLLQSILIARSKDKRVDGKIIDGRDRLLSLKEMGVPDSEIKTEYIDVKNERDYWSKVLATIRRKAVKDHTATEEAVQFFYGQAIAELGSPPITKKGYLIKYVMDKTKLSRRSVYRIMRKSETILCQHGTNNSRKVQPNRCDVCSHYVGHKLATLRVCHDCNEKLKGTMPFKQNQLLER